MIEAAALRERTLQRMIRHVQKRAHMLQRVLRIFCDGGNLARQALQALALAVCFFFRIFLQARAQRGVGRSEVLERARHGVLCG